MKAELLRKLGNQLIAIVEEAQVAGVTPREFKEQVALCWDQAHYDAGRAASKVLWS